MANNNAKKLKKKRKPMSPEAKRNLVNGFKSLISNQAAIDSAKELPWWIALILFVVSFCIPVIPTTVSLSKTYGASFMTGNNYGSDRGLLKTSETFKGEGYEFKVANDNLLHFYKAGSELTGEIDEMRGDVFEGYYNFTYFITSKTGSALNDYVTNIANAKYLKGTTTRVDNPKDEDKDNYYTPSYLILAPDTLTMAVYKNQKTDRATNSAAGLNWKNTTKGEDLLTRVLTVKAESTTEVAQLRDVYDNYKGVFNETYLDAKNIQWRNSSLLYLGVYAGLILFLGLMVFLLTRGRNNPYHFLNFFTCQKIAWWASFTPAVLALILGFIFGTNMIGQMSFIVLVSLRVMWLSMRQLRPM